MAVVKQVYNKPPLTTAEQIALLKSRGLVVEDEKKLEYYLRNVSYYHLSIYFKHYQNDDVFFKGITFEDVLRIYIFDNKLRFLLLELLERVEKSFKCRMAYELSVENKNAHSLLDEDMYSSKEKHAEAVSILTDEFNKSREVSQIHYREVYSEPPLPPIWMSVEILSFGQCVKICKSLKRDHRNKIARTYGEDEQFIMSWMHALSALRNNCAHHSRLWNRDFTIQPKMHHRAYSKFFVIDSKRIYNHLIVLQLLLRDISPESSWLEKLKELIEEYRIDPRNMGFPPGWEARLSSIAVPSADITQVSH